jgi:hypothetical protein
MTFLAEAQYNQESPAQAGALAGAEQLPALIVGLAALDVVQSCGFSRYALQPLTEDPQGRAGRYGETKAGNDLGSWTCALSSRV